MAGHAGESQPVIRSERAAALLDKDTASGVATHMSRHVVCAVISATEAARRLGDLLARVRYRGETFLIRRGRAVVARLGPAETKGVSGAEAARLWEGRARLGPKEAAAFERDVGAFRKTARQTIENPWGR